MGLIRKSPSSSPARASAEHRRTTRDFAGLLHQLGDARPAVRRWAAKDLAEHPAAVRALCARLSIEPDSAVRGALFVALTHIGGPEVVEGVVPFLRSDDAELRNATIDVLKNLPEATAERIEALLGDPDPDVRIFAINVLESLRHPRIEAWLDAVLERETHENVCATAIDLLGEIGTAASVPALKAAKARFTSDFTRFACDLALRRIGAS